MRQELSIVMWIKTRQQYHQLDTKRDKVEASLVWGNGGTVN